MKNSVLATLLLVLCLPAFGNAKTQSDLEEGCTSLSEFGKAAVKARQRGASITIMMGAMDGDGDDDENRLMKAIIDDVFAYSEDDILNDAEEFADEYAYQLYKYCIEE